MVKHYNPTEINIMCQSAYNQGYRDGVNDQQPKMSGYLKIMPRRSGKTTQMVNDFISYPFASCIIVSSHRQKNYLLTSHPVLTNFNDSIIVAGGKEDLMRGTMSKKFRTVYIDNYYDFIQPVQEMLNKVLPMICSNICAYTSVNPEFDFDFTLLKLVRNKTQRDIEDYNKLYKGRLNSPLMREALKTLELYMETLIGNPYLDIVVQIGNSEFIFNKTR